MSKLSSEIFLKLIKKATGLTPLREFKFHPTRRWRADFAFTDHKLLVEVEGGIWGYGRHNRASGFLKDMEKYNNAALLGYRILRFTPSNLCDKESINLIKTTLNV